MWAPAAWFLSSGLLHEMAISVPVGEGYGMPLCYSALHDLPSVIEVYQRFAINLHRVHEPSLQHYVRTTELKAAGMDWNEVLAAEGENRWARLAAKLLASTAYGSTAARVQAFVEQGGGCRATFFSYRRKLKGG
jgi:hypothetical protein